MEVRRVDCRQCGAVKCERLDFLVEDALRTKRLALLCGPALPKWHDTLTSIQLGEAVALSYLRDHATTYNESFTISLVKLDGTTATISNP